LGHGQDCHADLYRMTFRKSFRPNDSEVEYKHLDMIRYCQD